MTLFNHITAICPYCSSGVTFAWITNSEYGGGFSNHLSTHFKNKKGIWVIGECPSCKNCVLIRGYESNGNLIVQEIFPFPLPSPVDQRIPEKIKRDLEEAKLCFSVGAFNASVSMSRRALQRACKEKGAKKDNLADQIKEVAEKGVITSDFMELAHTIKLIGNDGAHPNDEEVKPEDAQEILNLAEQFMEVIFVAPAKVREIKEKREKK